MTQQRASRGRRPGSPETRDAILESARESFASRGYRGTTIRGVAGGAGVDPALVHHYFGTKDDLFLAALQVPVDPRQVLPAVLAEGLDDAAERLLGTVLTLWDDPATRRPLVTVVRAGLSQETTLLQDGFLRLVLGPLREAIGTADAEVRAQLFGTQMIGLIVARYVIGLEPLASLPREQVVAAVAPGLQRYLTGEL
ncbi:MAG TPA: TetR family transcriptional regulator [Nocardioidaceae bacterium]|nr:TetR family transcriptional regulator [Nocardioidaceae bacterium]